MAMGHNDNDALDNDQAEDTVEKPSRYQQSLHRLGRSREAYKITNVLQGNP
ncbi:hypothetical protein MGP2080_10128 [marine gamma proteobacterium HTCC2080]|nr:hypothetical protein MGP2080_10128 [marine gamma proteobacterium HTCC2080]